MVNALDFTSEAAYNDALDDEASLFSYANESQAAFTASQREATYPQQVQKIRDLVAQGRFVVVNRWVEFCPRTDAVLGTATAVVSDHATREEANRVYTDLMADLEHDNDFWYELQPFEAPVPAPSTLHFDCELGNESDVPF